MPIVSLKTIGVVPIKAGLQTTTANITFSCLLDVFEDKQDRFPAVSFGNIQYIRRGLHLLWVGNKNCAIA